MKINIEKVSLESFFLLFPLFQPEYFDQISMLRSVYDIWKVVAIVYVIFKVYFEHKDQFVSPFFISVLIMFSYQTIVTFAKDGNVKGSSILLLNIVGTCIIISYLSKRSILNTVLIMEKILFVHIICNLFTIILFPNGIYRISTAEGAWYSNLCWLLGFKNHILIYLFPALFANKLKCQIIGRSSLFDFILNFLVIVTTMLVDCSTGLAGVLFWYLGNIIFKCIGCIKTIRAQYIIGPLIILFPLLVVGRVQESFNFLIGTILKRDTTLTTRTLIWDAYISILSKGGLIFGYGQESLELRFLKTKIVAGVNCHNGYLEILYRGGGVMLLLFLFLLFLLGTRLNKIRLLHTNIYGVCLIGIGSLLLMAETELIFFSAPIWTIFSLASSICERQIMASKI